MSGRRRPAREAAGDPLYGRDLTHVHHVAFGELAREMGSVVPALLRDAGHTSGVVVDLGCGTGIMAQAIADAGFDVVGVDVSPSMIAVAKRHAPEARFHVGSLHDFELPPCVAVCAAGEAVGYLKPGEARVALAPLFSRVWNALEPGGLFLFDVVETGRSEPMSYRASRTGPDWELELVVREDTDREIITRTITTRRFEGSRVRSSTEVHRVQAFSRTGLHERLAGCGFRVSMDERYARLSLPPGRVGVIAEKPRT